jgi:hypothetical protein
VNGWLVTANIPATERRTLTLFYVANVPDKEGAAAAVKQTMRAKPDERLEVLRPATARELDGMGIGAVRIRNGSI